MAIFKKVSSFIKGKIKPKEDDAEPIKDLNKEICLYISQRLSEHIRKPGDPPENISPKQWKKILNQICWAWEHAHEGSNEISSFNKRVHKLKILTGFKLFIKYFKYIK